MVKGKSIKGLVKKFGEELERQNYSYTNISGFNKMARNILKFADEKGVKSYSVDFGQKFINERYPKTYRVPLLSELSYENQRAIRTIKMFNDLYIHGVIIRKRHAFSQSGLDKNDRLLLAEFGKHIQQDKSISSVMRLSSDAKLFIRFLNTKQISLNEIEENNITDYLMSSATSSKSLLAARQYSLKIFLKYLYSTGCHKNDLSEKFDTVRIPKHPRIPSVWNPDDVVKILNAVDRGSPLGKRDYAILMLVVRLGLRISDVKALQLSEINWAENRIELIQSKTKQLLSLPLLPDVGWAIIEYLKYGRPETNVPQVFLTVTPPIREISLSSSMANIVTKYANIAGVSLRPDMKHGMHSLRHSLASRLLEAKTPLPIISEVLGHYSPHEVDVYLKVDIEQLRCCALNPEEVFTYA